MSDETSARSSPSEEKRLAFPHRLKLYLNERFPITLHGILILSFYCAHQFLAESVLSVDAEMHFGFTSLAGCLTLFLFFLHLRLFDDCKDYAEDCLNYPLRELSRGAVSLSELKLLAGVAIGTEFLLSIAIGPAAFWAVLFAVGYSFLMLKEFFARRWLKDHFLVYALTHMLIVSWLSLVVFSFTTGVLFWDAPGWYFLYAAASYFAAFDLEISRKSWAPIQEIEELDSYSKRFGVGGAVCAALSARTIATIMVTTVGVHLGLTAWFFFAIWAGLALSFVSVMRYWLRPTERTAKGMELSSGLFVLASYLILAAALAVNHGVG